MLLEEEKLLGRAERVFDKLEKYAQNHLHVRQLYMKDDDKLRLLTLEVWSLRYRVPISWIFRTLVLFWRERFARYARPGGLGVKIATLCGQKSEEILRERIAREFPDGQEKLTWREREKEKQLAVINRNEPETKLDWARPQESLAEYVQESGELREKRKQAQKRFQRRRYRDNPWI